jgi:hypothetical protein
MRLFYQQIVAAAGHDLELVRVSDDVLPADPRATGIVSQHLLASSAKARRLLHWSDTGSLDTLARSVRWHLDHPPAESEGEFSADEAALNAGR